MRSGAIAIEEACRRYGLSEEEFPLWQRAFESHRVLGLRATRLPAYHSDPIYQRSIWSFPNDAFMAVGLAP
jgi:Protein of unknown function (DUF1153)